MIKCKLKGKTLKVLSIYTVDGKGAYYDITGSEWGIFSKEDLFALLNKGYVITNAYRRGNELVIQRTKAKVSQYKYSTPIKVKIDADTQGANAVTYFDYYIKPQDIDNTACNIIKEIDTAQPYNLDISGDFITPFGACDMSFLSAGCKTAVWGYLCEKNKRNVAIATGSMGKNALYVLLRELSECKVQYITLTFTQIPFYFDSDFDKFIVEDVETGKLTTFTDFFAKEV